MDDPTPDAPELELTTPPTGEAEDALQATPTDATPAGLPAGDNPFAMHTDAARPSAKAAPADPPMKPAKPVTAAANASVVAALMGRPIAKSKPAAAPAVSRVEHSGSSAVEPIAKDVKADVMETVAETDDAVDGIVTADTAENDAAEDEAIENEATTSFLLSIATPDVEPVSPEPTVADETSSDPSEVRDVGVLPTPPAVEQERGQDAHTTKTPQRPTSDTFEKGVPPAIAATPPARRAVPVAPVWPVPVVPPSAPVTRPATPIDVGIKSLAVSDDVRSKTVVPRRGAAPAPTSEAGAMPRRGSSEQENAAAIEVIAPASTGAWFTLPLLFAGICVIACAILVPAADENRRDTYELARMEQDVDYFKRQSEVNRDFLERVNTDATLAERLAMRQLHQTRQGSRLAPLTTTAERFGGSPYAMTRLDPPPPLPPYAPTRGILSDYFLDASRQTKTVALGILMTGIGLLLGGTGRPRLIGDAAPADA